MEILGNAGSVDDAGNSVVDPNVAAPIVDPNAAPADWYGALPEEMRADPGVKKFEGKAITDVLTSYKNLESKIGEKGILPLKEGATEEEKTAYFTALGRPENAEGYELAYPETFPEHLKDEGMISDFRTFAFKNGIPKGTAKALMQWHLGKMQDQHDGFAATAETARTAGTDALKTEWGAKFDEKLGVAEGVLSEFDPDFRDFLKSTGLNNDPRMIRHLYKVGSEMREDSKLKDGGNGPGAGSFEGQRDVLMKHPAFNDSSHKEHFEVHKKLTALYARQYPEDNQ